MKSNVLIVDDETGIRDLFTYILEPLGYKVTSVCDGVECIELLNSQQFDIIFLDIHMPRLNGIETLREIKKMDPNQKVVVMTSSSDPSGRAEKEAKDSFSVSVIEKPFGLDEIVGFIEND
ncbi:MAG: response regulator [Planctomycetota bacterium]